MHAATRFRSFGDALSCDRPAPELADKLALYGQFIGSWSFTARSRRDDGAEVAGRGEIHFGWVLDGRAVQDVWIWPGVFHGTTLRIYDPGLDAWHILWNDPVRQAYPRMLGRARGADIVQEGVGDNGSPIRWSFTKITPESFLWLGERTPASGEGFELQVEIAAQRIGASAAEQVGLRP
jgi:hypothetical protein